jgi:hypothetical protein
VAPRRAACHQRLGLPARTLGRTLGVPLGASLGSSLGGCAAPRKRHAVRSEPLRERRGGIPCGIPGGIPCGVRERSVVVAAHRRVELEREKRLSQRNPETRPWGGSAASMP